MRTANPDATDPQFRRGVPQSLSPIGRPATPATSGMAPRPATLPPGAPTAAAQPSRAALPAPERHSRPPPRARRLRRQRLPPR
jgi:hypothetical protein